MSGEEEWIVPGKNRRLVKPRGRDRRVKFGKAKRKTFVEQLAATCNVTASAEAAGVSLSAVYRCRLRDGAFRAAWGEALEIGYARLELALLEWSLRVEQELKAAGSGGAEPGGAQAMDWDKGIVLLAHHKRGLAGRPSTRTPPPQRAPFDEVARKLVKRLKAMGVTLPPAPAAMGVTLPPAPAAMGVTPPPDQAGGS